MCICEICQRSFNNEHGLRIHKLHKHENKYQGVMKKIAEVKKNKGFKHSEESKKKISLKRSEWLKNNKKNHNWSLYKNKETIPEKEFKNILQLIEVLNIYQYYKPEESERGFEIDFAIPYKKIGFEINGNQHYDENGNLAEYYLKRHNYLESLGWKIIEIPYNVCFNKEIAIEIIKHSLENNVNISQNICNNIINYRIEKKKKNQLIKQQKIDKISKEINDKMTLLLNSNIDFSKFGWVNFAAKVLDITPQNVNRWMKRNMLEFYNTNCFKRKNNDERR